MFLQLTLIRHSPTCGGHAPTAERTLHPARMLTESLTPRPELENVRSAPDARTQSSSGGLPPCEVDSHRPHLHCRRTTCEIVSPPNSCGRSGRHTVIICSASTKASRSCSPSLLSVKVAAISV